MGESQATPTTTPRKVHVVYLTYGGVCDELPMWLVANRPHMSSLSSVRKLDVVCARNSAAKLASQSGADWLLMINGDCCPPCGLPELMDAMGGYLVGAAHKEGPAGEVHAATNSMDTACMIVSTKILRLIYDPHYGWFPPPVYGADGCDWAACECTTFSNLLMAKGISFTHMPIWTSHVHEVRFPGKVVKKETK
jgi:hypothetical protein